MKMNLHRAQELIEPLKKGTAKGISYQWRARLIEALEYVIANEGGPNICYECRGFGKIYSVEGYPVCDSCNGTGKKQ